MALIDTPWCGQGGGNALYLQSGKFTSTLKTSRVVAGAKGITFDGTDTYHAGTSNTLFLTSAQFTSTVKDSENVTTIEGNLNDMSFDGTDTPYLGTQNDKFYLQSGAFTSTLKTSGAHPNTQPNGISFDGVDTPSTGWFPDKMYLHSGQFTTTVKSSRSESNDPSGISWDGTNSLFTKPSSSVDKLYLESGYFTSTILTSEDVTSINNQPSGICVNDFAARTGVFLGIVHADVVAATLAMPAPTIDLISNIVITPAALGLGIQPEDTAHVNSNHPRPNAIAMNISAPDPVVEFGNAFPATELSVSMNLFAPTIDIITQTIVELPALTITAAFIEGVATPDYSFMVKSLPMLTLSASIVSGFTGTTSLPMLTLSANCVVGFLTYTTQTLPMLTLNIRMGTAVRLTLPMLTLSASGTTTNGGSVDKPLPLLTLSAAGTVAGVGTLASSLPMFTVDIVMALGGIHTFASSLPVLTLDGQGTSGNPSATAAADLPLVTLSSSGYSDGNGMLTKALPILTLDAFGTSYINRII